MATQKARVTYTRARGLAEKIRFMLCMAEVPFENRYIRDNASFVELCENGDLLFKQMPMLEIDGMKLVQSHAIVRYLASRYSMYGKNKDEQIKVDMYYDAAVDFHKPVFAFGYHESKKECTKKGIVCINKFCPIFQKLLVDNGTGFLVGDSLSLADAGFFLAILDYEQRFTLSVFEMYPAIMAFIQKMKTDQRIQKYLNEVRLANNIPEDIMEIKAVYGKLDVPLPKDD